MSPLQAGAHLPTGGASKGPVLRSFSVTHFLLEELHCALVSVLHEPKPDPVKSRAPCKRVAAIVPSRYSFFPFWSWLPPLLVGQRVYAKFSP
jgi:hypothetical protein